MLLRISFILLLVTIAEIASTQTRPDRIKVTYKAVDKKLDDFLLELSEVGDVNIAFSSELIPEKELFTIFALNKGIGSILKTTLKNTSLSYKLIGNQIVIIKDEYKFAPEFLTISGEIVDRETGEALPYASIYLFDRSIGTESNEYGFFSLKLPKGLKRIYTTYLGYEKSIKEIKLLKDTIMTVGLKSQANLNEVLIVDRAEDVLFENTSSSVKLPLDRIRSIAALGGEPDVLRLAHLYSGISTGADGLGGINVRGGSMDQNLMLLDGVPVYNTSHGFGLFSVFNPNIIKSADIIKGSIPARYGGRLSSVIDVRTKDGNLQKTSGDISIGVVALKATMEGPIIPGKSSYIFSLRRTFLDPWIGNVTEYINSLNNNTGKASFYYYDFNGKVNYSLNKRNQLILSYYKGNDVFRNNIESITNEDEIRNESLQQDEWSGGNNVASIRLNTKIAKNIFSKTSLYFSNYNFNSFTYDRSILDDNDQRILYNAGLYESRINDYGLKVDVDHILNPSHYLRYGLHIVRHNYAPGLITFNESDEIVQGRDLVTSRILASLLKEPQISGNEYSAYAEDEFRVNSNLTINLGIHGNVIQSGSKTYTSIQPRVAVLFSKQNTFLKLGYTQSNQFLHLINNNGLGVPIDIWFPTSDIIRPEESTIYNVGLGFKFWNGYKFDIGGYYKEFQNLISIQEGAFLSISQDSNWESEIPIGVGQAYGFEANISKSVGQSIWMANYTYSKSSRTFSEINFGNPYDFKYNRDHQVKFAFIRKINANAEFSLNWLYGSGNPISTPSQLQPYFDDQGNERLLPVYLEKNNALLPDYHRLDIAFSFYSDFSWARQRFTIGLYNAYNRRNPAYIDIQKDRDREDTFELYQYSILPILPTVSYSLSF